MSKCGGFNLNELKKLKDELERLQGNADMFVEVCAKELAARLLSKVIKRTPVGDYPKEHGKKGGTLRRGWTKEGGKGMEEIKVNHYGDTYVIEIINPIDYASYVEYGHRTANHKGWVKGQFMMTISEKEIEQMAPGILEKKIQQFLGGAFK